MTYDTKTPIGTFLDAAAAKQPTPGGGSVTALVGALAAAMGEMTVNYSIGKKGLEQHQDGLRASLAELHRARQLLTGLMAEDQEAYAALTEAKKLPEGAPERESQFAVALLACVRVPQAMGAACTAILERCDAIVDSVNYYLLSDLAVCADLAMAATRCSIYNVRVNLAELTDGAERERIETATERVLFHASAVIQRVSGRIWERHVRGADA
jgi:formiminotetrahydrofolate cyclodeaminase